MEPAPIPPGDRDRVGSLRRLGLLDTGPEERFDRITRTARRLFDVDSAMVTLVDADRVWIKSVSGRGPGQSPRLTSFCGHAIVSPDVMVVPDTLEDARFADSPFILGRPHVRFYAGCPIASPDGAIVGTLCLMDPAPRTLGADGMRSLRDLAGIVEQEIAAQRLSVDDGLTGLANRRGFVMMAEQALAFCHRHQVGALVVVADIDGLRAVNDRHGRQAGDRLLRQAASSMVEAFRASDVVGRIGEEEFAAVLTSYRGEVTWATKRLATAVQACNDQMAGMGPEGPVPGSASGPVTRSGSGSDASSGPTVRREVLRLSMSVGSARFLPDDPELLESLLDRADTAMLADKEFRRRLAAFREPT